MLFMRDGESADIVRSCIIELARLDQSRTFEFFYTAVQPDDAPVIAGANFGFGWTTSSDSRPELLAQADHLFHGVINYK